MALTFEWDSNKAAQNIAKHGIDFSEAATVFEDPLSFTIPERLVVVAHTDLEDRIRIISARRATRVERQYYEEQGS